MVTLLLRIQIERPLVYACCDKRRTSPKTPFGKDAFLAEALPVVILSVSQLFIVHSVTNYIKLKRNGDIVSVFLSVFLPVCLSVWPSVRPSGYTRTFTLKLLNKFR
jgi:hypothetical protein